MKSIKWKLVAIYLGLVFIVLIMSGTFIIVRLENDEQQKIAKDLAQIIKLTEEFVIKSQEPSNFQRELKNMYLQNAMVNDFEIAILNSKGETIASSASDLTATPDSMPKYPDSSVVKALNGEASYNIGKIENVSDGPEIEWISLSSPFNYEGQYVVHVRTSLKEIKDSIALTTRTLILTLAFALVFTTIIGYFFARTITEPISILTDKTKDFTVGKDYVQIELQSNDEIGQLTDSFNKMALELNSMIKQISNEKNKLEVVLYNMTDGVLAFDTNKKLSHINPAAFSLLDLSKEILEIDYDFFVREFVLDQDILKKMSSDKAKEFIIEVSDKFIKVSAAEYKNEFQHIEGTIFVMQDITEQRRLDEMRKDFVANVSHELRTPITTIKSYAETLFESDAEDEDLRDHFLDIIITESDRMSELVQDLLQLSRFDNNQYKLDLKEVDVQAFLSDIVERNEIHSKEKNQTIVLKTIADDIVTVDESRINQVVKNILINAIKYCPENSEIIISTELEDSAYNIIIEDNGNGIAKEDLGKIFERFYRVDKTGSRQMGGTGLGLAIAKEIMEAHGGHIVALSEISVGTKIILSFPVRSA